MSELKPSSGSSGTSDRMLRAKALKKTQEFAKEEKVSCKMISPGRVLQRAVTEMDSTVDDLRDSSSPQATELFLRAVHEEQNGAFYEGMYCLLDLW